MFNIKNGFFQDSGSRIKNLAIFCYCINFILALIAMLIFLIIVTTTADDINTVLISLILAPFALIIYMFLAWIPNILIFGFGELIENTKNITQNNNAKSENVKTTTKKTALPKQETPPSIITNEDYNPCPVCGANVPPGKTLCYVCGAYISEEKI